MKQEKQRTNPPGTDRTILSVSSFVSNFMDPSRPRVLRRWLSLLVLLVPLCFLSLSSYQFVEKLLGYLNQHRQIARVLSVEATRIVGQEVKVGDLTFSGVFFSFTSANQIEFRDVSIAGGSSPNSLPIIRADKIAFTYSLAQILDQKSPHLPFIDEISFVKPQLLLSRDSKGRWNYESFLKPQKEKNRPAFGKISVVQGDIVYSDRAFPSPKGVVSKPLLTEVKDLRGVFNLRPNAGFAFDFRGTGNPGIVEKFHAVGTFDPETKHAAARLEAANLSPGFLTGRWVLPSQLTISHGLADLNADLVYSPERGDLKNFDLKALSGGGRISLHEIDAVGDLLSAPIAGLNGEMVFTPDSLKANLKGGYAGMKTELVGTLFGYSSLLTQNQPKSNSIVPPPAYFNLNGKVFKADSAKILSLKPVSLLVSKIDPKYRDQVRTIQAFGDLKFHLFGSQSNPSAILDGKLARLKYTGYQFENLNLKANYSNRILLADAIGRYAGGDANIRTRVEFDQRGVFQVEANGRNLRLNQLGVPIQEPLEGVGNLDFAVIGERGKTPNFTAQADVRDLKVRGQSIGSAYARADTQGPNLVLRNAWIVDKRGTAQASGTLDLKSQALDINLDADELNIGSIVKAFLPKMGSISATKTPSEPDPIFSIDRLEGAGYVRGKLSGSLNHPIFDGKLFAFDVSGGRQKFDRITLDRVHFTKEALSLKGRASRYPGEVNIEGEIRQPVSANPGLALDVSLRQQSLKHLLNLAGADTSQIPVTGTLSTDKIAIRGTVNAPYLPDAFTINLVNSTIQGLPIDNAAMTLRYRNEGIYVDNVSGEVADGQVVGSGWIPFEGGMEFSLQGTGVDLETLVESITAEKVRADQPLIEIKGEAGFQLHVTGSLKDPYVALDSLTGQNLFVNNFALGNLDTNGSYYRKEIKLDSVKLAGPKTNDGLVSVKNFLYNLDTKKIQTAKGESIRVDDFPVERVQQLAYNLIDIKNESARKFLDDLKEITGVFSASADVHGDLDHPEADLFWKTQKIVALKRYEITTLTGSATVNKDRIIYPSMTMPDVKIHLDSPYASVDSPEDSQIEHVVIELAQNGQITTILKPGYAGKKIPADLRVSNIDLKFLQDILNKDYSREISGQGDLGMTAVGLTHAPELQFTSNLRDVSFTPLDPTLPKISLDKIDLLPSTIREGKIELGELSISKKNATSGKTDRATLTGEVDGFTFMPPYIPEDARLSVTGVVSIPLLSQLSPQTLKNSLGNLVLKGDILNLGSKNPSVSGNLNILSPHLQFASLATGIQDVDGSLIFTGDRFEVKPGFKGRIQVFDKKGVPIASKSGSDIALSGSLPLGLDGASTKGEKDGLILSVPRLYFEESPFPGSKTGSARGAAAVNLKIIGSAKDPLITGKVVLTDASITPSRDDASTGGTSLSLPKYNLAVQLGRNVNLNTPQLDARLSTEQDLFLSNNIIYGSILLSQGALKLPVSRFQLLPGSSINIAYPVFDGTDEILGLNVDIKARGNITASSLSGVRKRYQVTVTARGPLTGETIDPITGKSNLALNFETNPNDLASSQQDLTERLAGAIIGVDSLSGASKNPGQAFAGALTGVFTGSVLPSIFDKAANTLGFEELSIGYDPIQRLNFSLSRKLIGPLYISYYQTLNAEVQKYDLKFSLRLKDRFQFSFDLDEQDTKKFLFEGVWKF